MINLTKPIYKSFLVAGLIIGGQIFTRLLPAANYSVVYDYDDLNRLGSVQYDSGESHAYLYDEVGNIEWRVANSDCFGQHIVLADRSFASGENAVCIGTTSISTGANVTVGVGSNTQFRAPAISLGPGFMVSSGGVFSAGGL